MESPLGLQMAVHGLLDLVSWVPELVSQSEIPTASSVLAKTAAPVASTATAPTTTTAPTATTAPTTTNPCIGVSPAPSTSIIPGTIAAGAYTTVTGLAAANTRILATPARKDTRSSRTPRRRIKQYSIEWWENQKEKAQKQINKKKIERRRAHRMPMTDSADLAGKIIIKRLNGEVDSLEAYVENAEDEIAAQKALEGNEEDEESKILFEKLGYL